MWSPETFRDPACLGNSRLGIEILDILISHPQYSRKGYCHSRTVGYFVSDSIILMRTLRQWRTTISFGSATTYEPNLTYRSHGFLGWEEFPSQDDVGEREHTAPLRVTNTSKLSTRAKARNTNKEKTINTVTYSWGILFYSPILQINSTMNKFLSLLLAVVAIAQVSAFMGTPVVTQRQVRCAIAS